MISLVPIFTTAIQYIHVWFCLSFLNSQTSWQRFHLFDCGAHWTRCNRWCVWFGTNKGLTVDRHATGPWIARSLWGPGLIVCRKTTRAFRHQHALPNNDDWVYLALFICFLYMLFLLELDFFPPVILILGQVMLLCFCHFFISALFELPKQIWIVLVNSNNTVPKCVPKI